MALETGNYISNLDANWPLGTDSSSTADDHLRLIKKVLKNTFPGSSGNGISTPIIATEDEINRLHDMQGIYPVGSIYMNANVSTNPSVLLGFGTWESIGTGRVLVGINTSDALFDTIGKTGGSKDSVVVTHNHSGSTSTANAVHSHTATSDIQGSHSHTVPIVGGSSGGSALYPVHSTYTTRVDQSSGLNGSHSHNITVNTGNASHSHSLSINNNGESGTNKNIQPYIVVSMWKRTA